MEELFERIRQYVDGHHDEILALWEEMVNTESGSRQLEEVAAMDDILHGELESVGAKVRVLPVKNAGGVLVVGWNSDSPRAPLLFIGHVDAVFKEGTAEDSPLRIDEQSRAHGPGVLDMKVGLVIAVHAIKALVITGFTGRPVKCVSVSDEENLYVLPNAEQVMMEEIRGAAVALSLETGLPSGRLMVGHKGGSPVSLTVHGVPAHSGNTPERGRFAVLEATHEIVALEAYSGTSQGKLINYGKVTGGIGEDTIPDLCIINTGAHFSSTEIESEILDALEQAASHSTVPGIWAELDTSRLMGYMDATDSVMALFRRIQHTAVRCGMDESGCFQVGDPSDSGITVACGIPTVYVMDVRGEGDRTPTEYIEMGSLFEHCILAICAAGPLKDGFTEQ